MSVQSRLDSIVPGAPTKARLRGEICANPQPPFLYQAIYRTVHGERARSKVIADALGRSARDVLRLADPMERTPLKAYDIVPMVLASGCFDILDALEQQVGRIAFRRPDAIESEHDELHAGLARTLNDIGTFVALHGESLKDGRLDASECDALVARIESAIAGLCEYRELAKARAEHDAVVTAGAAR